jgi:protein-tyrosine kinase
MKRKRGQAPAAEPESARPRLQASVINLDGQRFEVSPELVTLGAFSRRRGSESVFQLGSELLVRHFDSGRRALAVCGVSKGVGVSFMAANLAVALSNSGQSVLLVDANLRDPGLDRLIKPLDGGRGVLQAMEEGLSLADVVHHDVVPHLSVVYAGGVAANAQDLLESERFQRFLETGLRNYDFTLVDTPCANGSADARRIAAIVGYALIIVRNGDTYAEDVAELTRELRDDGVQVVGAVLNRG